MYITATKYLTFEVAMTKQVAVHIENDKFYPDNDAAIIFAELAKEPDISASTMNRILRLGGFEITVAPVCRGVGQAAIRNNVVRLNRRA